MGPVCTIMVGRLDDWLKVVAAKKGVITNPGYLEWAGVAAAKRAYKIFKERGYQTRLLNAAYRNHFHWSQFIGGHMALTIPYEWQKKFNASDVEVKNRIDDPVDEKIVAELQKKFPDFCRAYEEKGMSPAEFENFGATRRTLLAFLKSYDELAAVIRGLMISDPDVKGE
jgi:transaldolase